MDESLLPKELQTRNEATPQKVNKVVVGKARVKKPSLSKKFKEAFVPDDVGSIKEYVIWDQIIPALQDGLYNMVVGTLGMMFYGKVSGHRRNAARRSNANYNFGGDTTFSYDQINNKRNNRRDGYPRPRSNVVDEIEVDTYPDAAAVLEELTAYMEQYGRVRVSAYYEAFGVTNDRPWTDSKWGWTSLAQAKVVPLRGGGYTVYLPDPEPL